jgi:hypothetical protein
MERKDPKLQTLASIAAKHIHETFEVSEEKAVERAWALLETIEGKGGDPSQFSAPSLTDLVESYYVGSLKWRSNERQKEVERRRQDRTDAYNKWIDMGKSIWDRKW